MRRFAVLSLSLIGLWTLATSAAIGINRQGPVSPSLQALHLADCAAPCWIGIVPGETTLDAASGLVRAAFGVPPFTRTGFTYPSSTLTTIDWLLSSPTVSTWIKLNLPDGKTIDSITFDLSNAHLTVADLYSVLGPPSYMARWHNNYPYFVLIFGNRERGAVVATDLRERFTWTQQAKSFTLYGRGQSPVPPEDYEPWYGFLTLKGYFIRFP